VLGCSTDPRTDLTKNLFTQVRGIEILGSSSASFVLWSTYAALRQEYAALVTWGPPLEAGVATEIRL
jgi:hypothetical protein